MNIRALADAAAEVLVWPSPAFPTAKLLDGFPWDADAGGPRCSAPPKEMSRKAGRCARDIRKVKSLSDLLHRPLLVE